MRKEFEDCYNSFLASVTFYTIVPIPHQRKLEFKRIARWAPIIGIFLGGVLGLVDQGLYFLSIPKLTRTVLVIALWIVFTGGLHLDGVIDTADGLSVLERQRRLEVMKDSLTGAFGVMAGVILILLKTVALADLESHRWLALMISAGWGRWAQVIAISCYPYLRKTGKGSFHKESIKPLPDISLGLFCLISLSGVYLLNNTTEWLKAIFIIIIGSGIALATTQWFYHHFKGYTGDIYGALVEWTEALILCLLTGLFGR